MLVTPKLVSNGRTNGRCNSRRMISSIFIKVDSFGYQRMKNLTSICRASLITVSDVNRLGPSTQFEDSITFRVPGKGDYG